MAPSERTPLLSNQGVGPSGLSSSRPSELTQAEKDAIAQESAFSAIQDASHGVDPNSSAFAPPPDQSQFSIGVGEMPPVAEEAEERRRPDLLIIMGALWIGSFVSALDGTIVATILSTVGSEFRVSKEIGWLGTSYLLTQTAFQPLYGRLSDIFGRKAATLFASSIFLIGTLLCGLSQTFTQLCVARAIAGIGGGGLTSMSTIVTSDLVSIKSRGTWQGLGNLVYATGAAIGGPLGGALADGGLGWRWAFLIQVPLCIIHFSVVSWKVDIPGGPGSMIEKIKRIDFFGSITLVSSVAMILVGLSLGGNERPWSDKLVVGSLVGGLVVLVAFLLIEKFVAKEPLLPLGVVFNRTPGFVAIACWFITMSQFGIIFNVPLYFSAVEQTSSSYAGLHLIPNAIIASACSLGSGLLMAKYGKFKKILLIAGVLGFIGPLSMCFWQKGVTPEFGYWLTMPWGGAAYGGILTITLVALIASIDPKDMAAATGATYLFRATGSVLGISLSNAILQNSLQKNLEKAQIPKKIIAAIREDVAALKGLDKHTRNLAIVAYQSAMRTVFIAIAVAGFCALLAVIPIPEKELPGSKPKVPATIVEEEEEEEEEEVVN
ncbi:MFS general substrate transporter [Violaceomyces palustris]|uniref:MFS general substrate transporter n=1 Tax=Violaceomyces palustris TaxID=1673888 RepID=A0ACD0P090_9BASI|nr:MFS general substrate transporter [Violaceomyces palustris]